ncbi:DUF1642 domain-containing protein [Enterococcus faecium]|nr:DUF1642 domain-containing protein [Enterococcus faecium]
MNKQEQKNKLWALKWIDKEIEENERHAHQKTGTEANTTYWKGYIASCKNIRYIVKELDEPQKPVVPPSIALLIENYKESDVQLIDILVCFKDWSESEEGDYRDEISWVVANPETFMRAWLFGYEVEKEPLYRVKLGEGYFVEYQGRGALIMPDCNKEIKIFDSKSDAERTAQTIGGTVEGVVEG